MGFHNLVNTAYFSEAANDYIKNKGIYTKAPRGSRDYYDFWELQDKRCLEGYKVGDLWITGRHYFYLNFTPIWRVPDEKLIEMHKMLVSGRDISNLVADKELTFPRFWEIDYEWWNFKHIAWYGGTFMGINSPGGRHLCALKTRGAGFSYKEAADAIYNYNFIEGSKAYFFAGIEEYLTKDGILNKVSDMLTFMDTACPYWAQNRQKKNTLMHQRASWLDELGREQGTMSEIMGVIVDNENKTRGKRGRKIVFEESGSFKNLLKAVEISQGSIRSGAFYVGQMSVFGTGGEEGPSIEGLDEIYNNPIAWDMLSFPNTYDNGTEGTECGYFVPCFRANEAAFDLQGNVDIELAIKLDNIERTKKKQSKNPHALDARKAEYPRNASEALMRMSFNDFNIAEIDSQLRRILGSNVIQGYLRNGTMIQSEKGAEFIPLPNANPILHYPHKNTDDLTGCVTVFEKPIRVPYMVPDERGNMKQVLGTPPNTYFITVDPVYKEDAEDLTSLFSVQVWKQYNDLDPANQGLPIAWYTCRPRSLRAAYNILFLLAEWYNCNIQSEIAGGGQGIIDYAREKKLLHKLEYEISIDNKEISLNDTRKNRSYFMNINDDKKMLGMRYLVDWTMEVRGMNEQSQPIRNMHRTYDIALLREMRKYNSKRNADRISCTLLAMFMLKKKALETALSEEYSSSSGFFNRTMFGGQSIQRAPWESSVGSGISNGIGNSGGVTTAY